MPVWAAGAVWMFLVWSSIVPTVAHARQAHFVEVAQHDITTIDAVGVSQAYYGELENNPHLYEFTVSEPATVFSEILVPDIEEVANDRSGLILEVLEEGGGVREVARLPAKGAAWESYFEWASGDSYRRGASFYESLEPGTYQLEVSTPVNIGKYVLVVGTQNVSYGYRARLGDMVRIKDFFDKPRVMVVQSPYVYVPLALVGVIFWGVYLVYTRRTARAT